MNYTLKEINDHQNRLKVEKHRRKSLVKNFSAQTIGYAILIFYVFVSIMPFIWSVFVSFKNPHLIMTTGLNPFPKSGGWTTENYDNLFNGAAQNYVMQWISNTLFYAIATSLLNATFNLLGGYALAQIAMKGKHLVMSYFLVSILVPSQATFVPTYFIFTKLGIISNDISINFFILMVVFSGMANIILTFMARQFFLTQTAELEEASAIEGYNKIRTFFKITLRKMLPLFATQVVLVFMGAWNNYLTFTLYAVGDPYKMTINAGILNIARTAIDKEVGYGQMLAMSNISFVPMFVIYLISLKIQLRGIKAGNK